MNIDTLIFRGIFSGACGCRLLIYFIDMYIYTVYQKRYNLETIVNNEDKTDREI